MKQTLFALSLGFGAVILLTQNAAAQTTARQCGPRDQVVERLNQKYGETRRSIGLAGAGAVMEVYASDDTGSWTITVTLPDGRMCLVAAGHGFEPVDDPLPAAGRAL